MSAKSKKDEPIIGTLTEADCVCKGKPKYLPTSLWKPVRQNKHARKMLECPFHKQERLRNEADSKRDMTITSTVSSEQPAAFQQGYDTSAAQWDPNAHMEGAGPYDNNTGVYPGQPYPQYPVGYMQGHAHQQRDLNSSMNSPPLSQAPTDFARPASTGPTFEGAASSIAGRPNSLMNPPSQAPTGLTGYPGPTVTEAPLADSADAARSGASSITSSTKSNTSSAAASAKFVTPTTSTVNLPDMNDLTLGPNPN